jgi:hypothetical protein
MKAPNQLMTLNWQLLFESIENATNGCHQITVYEGDAALLKDKKNLIIANINRNILLTICKVMLIVWIQKVRFF